MARLYTYFFACCMSLLAANVVQAQCGYVQCCGAGHYLEAISASNDNLHPECKLCNGGACHPVCGTGLIEEEGNVAVRTPLPKAYQLLLAAADVGDTRRVIQLSSAALGFVVFNPERRSIQLKNCSGDYIANLPVEDHRLLVLAHDLPRASDLFAVAPTFPLLGSGR